MPGADFDSIGRPREIPFNTTESIQEVVPTDRLYEIFAVAFVWGASGNAGNRLIEVRIINRNGATLYRRQSQRTQVANESIRYVWAPGMPDETDVTPDQQLLQPMPLLQIQEAGSVQIEDAAGIDAADTLVGSFIVREYKAD